VACAVMKMESSSTGELTALVASNDSRATGDAMRALRRAPALPPTLPIVDDDWGIFSVDRRTLSRRPIWRLREPGSDRSLRDLSEALPSIGTLFDVRQGIQTGHNPALLLTEHEWSSLPRKEK